MLHKLEYFLTEQQKAEIREHLIITKFQGDLSDWLFQTIKMNVLNTQSVILAGKWVSQGGQTISVVAADLDAIKDTSDTIPLPKAGESRNVITVGSETLKGLQLCYKLECHINVKLNKPRPETFADWLKNFVQMQINAITLSNMAVKMEKEHEDLLKQTAKTPAQ